MTIRRAEPEDAGRIAEILVFNNRINYWPIFQCEEYSFGELQVLPVAEEYRNPEVLDHTYVYDDGIIRGMVRFEGEEIQKLYVDPFFQSRGIGAQLLDFAVENGGRWLWALEKNVRGIAFYQRSGFVLTDEWIYEEDTTERLLKMKIR